jgi:putative transposase
LEHITVRYMDTDFGLAVPQRIGRHVHPMAKPATGSVVPTGIDYLGLVEASHRQATGQPIGYSDLAKEVGAQKEESK